MAIDSLELYDASAPGFPVLVPGGALAIADGKMIFGTNGDRLVDHTTKFIVKARVSGLTDGATISMGLGTGSQDGAMRRATWDGVESMTIWTPNTAIKDAPRNFRSDWYSGYALPGLAAIEADTISVHLIPTGNG